MEKRRKHRWSGLLPGFLNGLLGTGGGILAVQQLKARGCSPQEAHATALGLMLPLSALSLGAYWIQGQGAPLEAWPLFVPALLGAVGGGWLLRRLSPQKLRLLFALLLLFSGLRGLWA